MKQKTVSVVISSRDEMPNIVHTVHSIVNDLETFLKPDDFEIIIVDNGSEDDMSWRYLVERGMFYHRTVRLHHDPIMGNVSARNKGAAMATGKYLFFSDAHMSYRIGSFKKMIEAIDKYGGMAHASVQWMGGYEPSDPSLQYTIKIGEKIWGTWNNYSVSKEPYFIPVSGHCFLGMMREQFNAFGGYNPYFRCYGGGEVYLDMKWWMLGSSVVVVPEAVGYHLSAGRGYSYFQNDLIHNMMLLGYALGADAMGERVYIRYLGKQGTQKSTLDKLHDEAMEEASADRAFIPSNQVMSFYEVIEKRPWDMRNDETFGNHNSAVAIFDKTWTDELSGEAKEMFNSSQLQKELSEWIQTKVPHLVYKGSA